MKTVFIKDFRIKSIFNWTIESSAYSKQKSYQNFLLKFP